MSRTVRRLMLRRDTHGAKYFRHRFRPLDINVLKQGKPPHPASRMIWVRVEDEPCQITIRQPTGAKPPPNVVDCYESHEWHGEYAGQDIMVYWVKSTRSYWHTVWNPLHDSDVDDRYRWWHFVHSEVHRNGSCRRQRLHGVAKSKRILVHHRRREQQRDLSALVAQYFAEEGPV